jgi:hypothetical protein
MLSTRKTKAVRGCCRSCPCPFRVRFTLNKCWFPNTRAREEAVVVEEAAKALEVVAWCLPEARGMAAPAAAGIAG